MDSITQVVPLRWDMRNSSGVGDGIDKLVMPGGGMFLPIAAGCRQSKPSDSRTP